MAGEAAAAGSFREYMAKHKAEVAAELQGDAASAPKPSDVMSELARRWKGMPADARLAYARSSPENTDAGDADATAEAPVRAPPAGSNDGNVEGGNSAVAGPASKAWHPPLETLSRALLGESSAAAPVGLKMRAIYYLRTLGTPEAVSVLCRALSREAAPSGGHSPLLRHEVAYVLGQIRDEAACPALERTLSDADDDVMVRHECAEALGAIGAARSLPLLERLSKPSAEPGHAVEIVDTCRVATDFCRWKASGGEERGEAPPGVACACMLSPYASHDPAPPDSRTSGLSDGEVGAVLRDETRPLFERYGAMFALRNRGGQGAVRELGLALTTDASSALLRHEVAFVLGQMQHPAALGALAESLSRPQEHAMVRHEAAEALGALEFPEGSESGEGGSGGGGGEEERQRLLLRHRDAAHEPDSVVRESCEVALDATDYWATLGGDVGEGGGHDGAVTFKDQKTRFEVQRSHFNVKCA